MSGGAPAQTPLTALQDGRGYVARGWCQGMTAQNANATPVWVDDTKAVGWSARGALWRGCARPEDWNAYSSALSTLEQIMGAPIDYYNDDTTRTQADILAAYDQAISKFGGMR